MKYLRADASGQPIGVEDRTILGYVVAQEGPFKSMGRGEFDEKSLKSIVKLMKANPRGTKSRLGHPTLSDDGVGRILGRAENPRLDEVSVKKDGKRVTLQAVRADLTISKTALAHGYGQYVLDMAKEDAGLLSSSLVLETDQEIRLENGRPSRDEAGNELPPLWRPTRIYASDIVDTGDAVDELLSPRLAARLEELNLERFDNAHRAASLVLDKLLPGLDRAEAEHRLHAFLARYLCLRYGVYSDPAMLRRKLDLANLTLPGGVK